MNCIHEIDESWCATCKGQALPSESVRSFRAEFASACPACGELIERRDTIYLVDGVWVCRDCRRVGVSA